MSDTPNDQTPDSLAGIECALNLTIQLMEEGFNVIWAKLDALEARLDALEANKKESL